VRRGGPVVVDLAGQVLGRLELAFDEPARKSSGGHRRRLSESRALS
jgi:hypothetical protein